MRAFSKAPSKVRAAPKLQVAALSVLAAVVLLCWALIVHDRAAPSDAPFRGPAVTYAVLARRARDEMETQAESAACLGKDACPQTQCTLLCSADGCLPLSTERGLFAVERHYRCEDGGGDTPAAFPRRCELLLERDQNCEAAAAPCHLTNASALSCDEHRSANPLDNDLIPPILHLVYPSGESEEWPFWAYLHAAIASAVLKPSQILFHHPEGALPHGRWWSQTLPLLKLMPQPRVTSVYDNPVALKAHQSDVMRLEALIQHGGIYLDSDVLVLRPFQPLLHNSFVIGVQSPGRTANAVLLSSPGNAFARRWADAYHTYNGSRDWDAHSVRTPWQLAEQYPGLVTWLPATAWFRPGPDDDAGHAFFVRRWSDAVFERMPQAYAHHLWHTLTKAELARVYGPEWVWAHRETLYGRCVLRVAENIPEVARLLAAQRN